MTYNEAIQAFFDNTTVVVKTAGYTAQGTFQSIFCKRDKQVRCVIEYNTPAGLLHIHNLDQISYQPEQST